MLVILQNSFNKDLNKEFRERGSKKETQKKKNFIYLGLTDFG